ncbi:MAG TPA: hypothetical protein VJM31_15390 [Vicinamibacterales bacterium]|nr:hypothetical protein [Vicinamibacterales bacterium]
MRVFIAIVCCVAFPVWSEAQAMLPRNDAAFSIGWAGSQIRFPHTDPRRPSYELWRSSLLLGVSGGHYWTDHLKTDVEAGWYRTPERENYQDVVIDGRRTLVSSTYRIRDARLAIGQSFQFGRNASVHPYVGAGAEISRRSVDLEPVLPGRTPIVETSTLVRPFVKAGAKMYASEKLFFVTDLKVGFNRDLDHVLWKIGVGFDF